MSTVAASAGNSQAVAFKGNDKLLFGMIMGVIAFWLFNARSFMHFQLEVGGHAPAASRYAGFSARQTVWFSLVMS